MCACCSSVDRKRRPDKSRRRTARAPVDAITEATDVRPAKRPAPKRPGGSPSASMSPEPELPVLLIDTRLRPAEPFDGEDLSDDEHAVMMEAVKSPEDFARLAR